MLRDPKACRRFVWLVDWLVGWLVGWLDTYSCFTKSQRTSYDGLVEDGVRDMYMPRDDARWMWRCYHANHQAMLLAIAIAIAIIIAIAICWQLLFVVGCWFHTMAIAHLGTR
jgi:hypothetical protein